MSSIGIIFTILLIAIAGVAALEFLSRTQKISKNVIRKTGHVGLAFLISAVAFWQGHQIFIYIGLILVALALILRQLPLKSLAPFKSSSYGEILFPLGVALAAFFSTETKGFIAIMLILGLADTAAFVAGKTIKSPKILGQKTVAGTLAFVLMTTGIFSILGENLFIGIFAAVILGVIELISAKGSDNITVPLTASLILLIFGI